MRLQNILPAVFILMASVLTAAPKGCPASLPLGNFELLVDPGTGSAARPLRSMNAVLPGQKIVYRPGQLPADYRKSAEIALVLAPESGPSGSEATLTVLEHHPASEPGEWNVEKPVGVVALVFGPQGLDTKKVTSLVNKDRELVSQLADYAEQTSQVETLIDTLTAWEGDPTKSNSLDAAVSGIAAQSGASITKLDRTAPTNEQALSLMRAVNPALNSYDPLAQQSGARFQQSAGLAASVAGLFLGNTVGLAAGGAMMVQNLRTMMFPDTAFRSALVQSSPSGGLTLCAKREAVKSRTRLAYLWAIRLPNVNMPALSVGAASYLPFGMASQIEVKSAEAATWKYLNRARNWQMVSREGKGYLVPVVVIPGKGLSLDLAKVALPAGAYKLKADWDWDGFEVAGDVNALPLPDFAKVKVSDASADKLVTGSGMVHAKLEGADFQFVEKVALRKDGEERAVPTELTFTLPKGKRAGPQDSIEVEVDTSKLAAGRYRLLLTQSGSKAQPVALRVLPPHPAIRNVPLAANFGEKSQVVVLRGAGLDRIEQIQSGGAEFALETGGSPAERHVTVRLKQGANKGDRMDLDLKVEGVHQPLHLVGALTVLGPRPKIGMVKASLPEDLSVVLHESELPAGAVASFSMQVDNLASDPTVRLRCASGGPEVAVRPGERRDSVRLESAGQGLLFLSVDPASAGQPGCDLTASVEVTPEGASEPATLGKIVRLPRIKSFTLTEEALSPGVYAGVLRGEDLEIIEKTSWDAQSGLAVKDLPKPVAGSAHEQMLRVALPWPSPAPHSPLYVWLRGETAGRATKAKY
ncbi:MAG: hypothetical protein LLG20_01150 [Acidobacteriales bacterium]|nr:hypothetical protein [Terriglobales bacterium]